MEITVEQFTRIEGFLHLGSPEQMQGSTNYPHDNPTPTHGMAIEGTVSPTLHLKINTVYEGKIVADCYNLRPLFGNPATGLAADAWAPRLRSSFELQRRGENAVLARYGQPALTDLSSKITTSNPQRRFLLNSTIRHSR